MTSYSANVAARESMCDGEKHIAQSSRLYYELAYVCLRMEVP